MKSFICISLKKTYHINTEQGQNHIFLAIIRYKYSNTKYNNFRTTLNF